MHASAHHGAIPPHRCIEDAFVGGGGFAFVIQTALDGADALGCAGSGLGLGRRLPNCTACVGPALAIQFVTHSHLRYGLHGEPIWNGRNELKLLSDRCHERSVPPSPPPPPPTDPRLPVPRNMSEAAWAEALATAARPTVWDQEDYEPTETMTTLQATVLSPLVYIDDGAFHQVRLNYFPGELVVTIDDHRVMTAAIELRRRADDAPRHAGTPPPPPTASRPLSALEAVARANTSHPLHAVTLNPTTSVQAAVLDRRGAAFLGLVGASGPIGAEQYHIGAWRFRRVFKQTTGPPLTEDEAAALDEAAEAAARAASPPSPLSSPPLADDNGDLDGDLGSGSGES